MTALLDWLAGKAAAPLAGLCALGLAAALLWQTARIDGWPFAGGGFKAQVAALQQQIAARDLAAARAQAAALQARQEASDAANVQARAHAAGDLAIQNQIQTVMQKVPVYVDDKSDAGCVLPWGAVRLLDAAAGGAGLDDVAARIAPGQPDGAPSDVKLSEAVALLARDLGIARQNAGQLEHLEKAVDAPLHK
ncbi:MAG TPA: hypothetical protein VHC40_14295 [Rhizomicrobium sp.]|nr:hypothetical protein [Rhizomicrobium sp.]